VFELDLEHCPSCCGALAIIAAILEQPVIEKSRRGLQRVGRRCKLPGRRGIPANEPSAVRVRQGSSALGEPPSVRSAIRASTDGPTHRMVTENARWNELSCADRGLRM
jgi:hypothetical protein